MYMYTQYVPGIMSILDEMTNPGILVASRRVHRGRLSIPPQRIISVTPQCTVILIG